MIRYVTDAGIVLDDSTAHQEEEKITDDSPNTEQSENVASQTNNEDTQEGHSTEFGMLSENDTTLARFLISRQLRRFERNDPYPESASTDDTANDPAEGMDTPMVPSLLEELLSQYRRDDPASFRDFYDSVTRETSSDVSFVD